MKKSMIKSNLAWIILVSATILTLVSCRKDGDGSPDVKVGSMSSGTLDPGEASGGSIVTLNGSGIGDIRSIVFDRNNVPAPFLSTLNTETALVFTVPDTAYGGPQNVIFTNSKGLTLTVPFSVIALPSISTAFPTDFEAGSTVTITGNNLDDVSSVVLDGTTDAATIVSQSRKEMVITMPATTVNRAKLLFTNSSGERLTNMEFVNVANALPIFTEGYVNPAQNWSWGGVYDPSTEASITGNTSLKAAYDPAGSWGGLQIGMGSELPIPAGSRYFTYWIKGADIDKNITVQVKGNGWSTDHSKVVTVPAGKWTYYREDLTTFMPGVNSVSVIVFQMHDAGKTVYMDNIMFIK